MTDDSMTREEAQSMKAADAMNDAERLLRRRRHGVLCSNSKRADGWPFGSVVPYAVDDGGRPVVLVASIAEHTRNMDADPRVSLLVQSDPPDGDVQAEARLCVMGRATVIPENEIEAARARYLARLPEAEGYFATHDFSFRRIEVDRLRYIGGFGKIFWLDVDLYRARYERDPLTASRDAIVDHMNADHADTLRLYCRAFQGFEPSRATMTAVDRWGFDVVASEPDRRVRFDFEEPAAPDTIRGVMVELARRARAV